MYKIIFIFLLAIPFYSKGQFYDSINSTIIDTTLQINSQCPDYYYLYFYSVKGKYPQSSNTILENVKSFVKTNNIQIKGSGYITYKFVIDCEGKMIKNLKISQTSDKYQSIQFDVKVIEALYRFIKSLDKWEKKLDSKKLPTNYIAFISLKIQNGEIINIIP